MPISFAIDAAARVVTLTYSEDVTFDEWASAMDAVFRDPAFRPGFGLLLDRRQLTRAPDSRYIQKVVAYMRARSAQLGGGRVANLVSSDAAYGMARMAQILLERSPDTGQVFTDLDRALSWLREGEGSRPTTSKD